MALARDGGLWIAGDARTAQSLGAPSQSEAGTANGTITCRPSRCKSTTSRSRTRMTKASLPRWLNRRRITRRCWPISTASIGQPRPSPSRRSGMPGAAADRTDWAATIDSLFEWEPGGREVIESEESSARQYYDVAVEPGGAFWLATSDGLFRYAPLTWRSPAPVQADQFPRPRSGGGRGWPAVVRRGRPRFTSSRMIAIRSFRCRPHSERTPGGPRPVPFEEWQAVARRRRPVPAVSA